jgi:3-dehydroquinate synthase
MFKINNKILKVEKNNLVKNKFYVKSGIRSYEVNTNFTINKLKALFKNPSNYFIIDSKVAGLYFKNHEKTKHNNIFFINSSEKNKNIKTANKIIDFFIKKKLTKINTVYAIGGGIVQDLAGYSCYVYKRGIPWVYAPTTMLGIADSCVGGKVALNYKNTKNIMALFSAPRKVFICFDFLKTTSQKDFLSGLGEAFRLHITGGKKSYDFFKINLENILKKKKNTLKQVIISSLLIKKAVVEFDEYETDIRRSMNFGHSIGHAYESVLDYKIPHGLAVALGICLELILMQASTRISKKMINDIIITFSKFFPKKYLKLLESVELKKINDVLQRDKKTEGQIIKIAVPVEFGNMKFLSKKLDNQNIVDIKKSNESLLFHLKCI